jgi:hypothetical protein
VLTTVPRALRRMADVVGISAGVACQRAGAQQSHCAGVASRLCRHSFDCLPTDEPQQLYSGSESLPPIIEQHKLMQFSRSQWSRGLRCGSATARLLRFWIRIPPGLWISAENVVCCQVEVSVTGRSAVQRSPTDCGVSECDSEARIMRRLCPTVAD